MNLHYIETHHINYLNILNNSVEHYNNIDVINLCNKYNIDFEYSNIETYAIGMGDILFSLLLLKYKLFDEFVINLNFLQILITIINL
jgi:hypothetical protein